MVTLALALMLSSAPAGRGAALTPASITATLSGVQIGERVSYAFTMENTGDLPALGIGVSASLPAGLTLVDTGLTVWIATWAGQLDGHQSARLGFIVLIDGAVATGTVAVIDAVVTYRSSGDPQAQEAAAHSELTIAARGGVPLVAWIGALAGGVLVLLGYAWKVRAETVRIDQLYLLHDSGMLIRHYSNGHGVQRDSDIMSGMLIILQEFVRDSFNDSRNSLEEVRFGNKRVLMARGQHSIMAAVVTGKRLNGLPVRLHRAIGEFERVHLGALRRWNGNLASLDSADVALRSVLAPKYRAPVPT